MRETLPPHLPDQESGGRKWSKRTLGTTLASLVLVGLPTGTTADRTPIDPDSQPPKAIQPFILSSLEETPPTPKRSSMEAATIAILKQASGLMAETLGGPPAEVLPPKTVALQVDGEEACPESDEIQKTIAPYNDPDTIKYVFLPPEACQSAAYGAYAVSNEHLVVSTAGVVNPDKIEESARIAVHEIGHLDELGRLGHNPMIGPESGVMSNKGHVDFTHLVLHEYDIVPDNRGRPPEYAGSSSVMGDSGNPIFDDCVKPEKVCSLYNIVELNTIRPDKFRLYKVDSEKIGEQGIDVSVGLKPYSNHGIEIAVPESHPINQSDKFGEPIRHVVIGLHQQTSDTLPETNIFLVGDWNTIQANTTSYIPELDAESETVVFSDEALGIKVIAKASPDGDPKRMVLLVTPL